MNCINHSCKLLNGVYKTELHACTLIPKRFRYYWEARPENRNRKLLMQITLPRLKPSPAFEPPKIKYDTEKLYGLDLVLQREVREMLSKSRMIAVYLWSQMDTSDYYRMRHAMRKENIFLEDYPNHVMELTLKDTPFRNLANLYENHTLTIFSEELKVKEMLQVMRKIPYVSLMGGMVENRLMSSNQMMEYSKLPPISHCHGELSFLLSSSASTTSSILQRNQSLLSMSLSQYIKDRSKTTES